jgi:hypothetical protein
MLSMISTVPPPAIVLPIPPVRRATGVGMPVSGVVLNKLGTGVLAPIRVGLRRHRPAHQEHTAKYCNGQT